MPPATEPGFGDTFGLLSRAAWRRLATEAVAGALIAFRAANLAIDALAAPFDTLVATMAEETVLSGVFRRAAKRPPLSCARG